MKTILLSLVLIIPVLTGCDIYGSLALDPYPTILTDSSYYYDIENPDIKVKLSEELEEVSGLSYFEPGKLLAIQDELSNVYLLDATTGSTLAYTDFGKEGDYEGVEFVDGDIWVLRSNGSLYRFAPDFEKEDIKSEKIETGLKIDDDNEGLGFDPVSGHLIVAPKDHPDIEDGEEYAERVLFHFDRSSKKLVKQPYLQFTEKQIENFVVDHGGPEEIENLKFKPSGVAIHPITGDIYVLSSVGKGLAVFNKSGLLKNLYFIPNKQMRQPEGIAFAPDGTLYIASEGDDSPGKLFVFNPRRA